MLSPWKVICSSASLVLILFLVQPTSVEAASPFPGETIPEECFLSGVPERRGDANDLIFEDPLEAAVSKSRGLELPPEGEHYSRVITRARQGWEFTDGSPEVTVAIVDSGIDLHHPDLAENLWVNVLERDGKPGVDDDGNGFVDDIHGWDFVLNRPVALDRTGHGTHCAGNAAAVRNHQGVIGVAPKVRIMAVRFMDNGSGTTVNAIKALVYAAQNGAQVISNSWSSSRRNECVRLAIEYAHRRGAIVVASANNQKRDVDKSPSYPGSFPGVIAVGSSNERDERSRSSNWGKSRVYIFAPGEASLSTDRDGTYSVKTGTSMAAPQVAGALALGLSYRPETERSILLQELCMSSALSLKDLSKCGRLDVGAFIERLSRR